MFSISEHFHDVIYRHNDDDVMEKWLSESADAYMSLSGPSKGYLPPLHWNGSLRKANTILFWVRPRKNSRVDEDNSVTGEGGEGSDADTVERLFYSYASTEEPKDMIKDTANNLKVACSKWILTGNNTVETTITASNNLGEVVTASMVLQLDIWQLVVFSHVFPYLKRPTWTASVQGHVIVSGPLSYPVVERGMDDSQCLSNIVAQDPIDLDVSSFSIYPNIAVGTTIQALCAAMGPQLPLQTADGRVIPTLPPICNWSKGSSLEGPKVGIPLTVHAAAMELQHLSGTAIVSFKATSARSLGQDDQQNRIIWPFERQQGSTVETPRVGLVQPSEPLDDAEESPQFYATGHVRLYNALDAYLTSISQSLTPSCSPNLYVVLQEQKWSSAAVLNFFLALCPPTRTFDVVPSLYEASLQKLFHMYSNDGTNASKWIRWLALYIRNGGARVHEEILQAGTLHVLASTLRCSLLRAIKYQVFTAKSVPSALLSEEGLGLQTKHESMAPSYIPSAIIEASVDLVASCCGPESISLHDLLPGHQIQRTSDISLSALFGFAMDLDLWGGYPAAVAAIAKCISLRFGGFCITSGYVLRSQMSVQHFLDAVRLRLESRPSSRDLEDASDALCLMLQAMLLSSLVNRRNIAQGEHDVEACINCLSDATLGRCAAHIILNAIVGILVWCEVFPPEAALGSMEPAKDEERKMQVASRLGRNLLICQFHEVIAPMILSRTAFSGGQNDQLADGRGELYEGHLCWEYHWRQVLLLFSWVVSVAGPEGQAASSSCGQLMYASALAGSLKGALKEANQVVLTSLFMPPPGMSMLIGSTFQNEWSYTDLLSERLNIMMPLLPSMMVSLLTTESERSDIPASSLEILAHLLTSVGGAFHRVYGGDLHSTTTTRGRAQAPRKQASSSIRTAKSFVPDLLTIAMVFEKQIGNRDLRRESDVIQILRPVSFPSDGGSDTSTTRRRTDSDSWVDVSHVSESSVTDLIVEIPSNLEENPSVLLSVFQSFQMSTMQTAAGLMSNAMTLGGAGTALVLWQSVLSTLETSTMADEKNELKAVHRAQRDHYILPDEYAAKGVLCRLVAFTLRKALKRENPWDLWSFEVSSAVAKTCSLIEEKNLLVFTPGSKYGDDQTLLLCVVLEVLSYGRESTGWCQLSLPNMPDSHNKAGQGDVTATSKLLLPVLQPCYRILLSALPGLSSKTKITYPNIDNASEGSDELLLIKVVCELEKTLTAAIVGLTFATARDTALGTMAVLRQSFHERTHKGDLPGSQLCCSLISKVAEELRVRYESERRLRETALFDAYEGYSSHEKVANESEAVERIVFGGDGLGLVGNFEHQADVPERETNVSDDFVLFHEPDAMDHKGPAKLGFPEYKGLGLVLESIKSISGNVDSVQDKDSALSQLSPFLDSWDAALLRDKHESELVNLFDTTIGLDGIGQGQRKASATSKDPGPETAADTMSSFFEYAAVEKARLKEIANRFMPAYRYSRLSFSERFCWSEFADSCTQEDIGFEWERGISDGNRDIRSRLTSIPTFPQFRPYIPGYLDHGSSCGRSTADKAISDEHDAGEHERRVSIMPLDTNAFTKTLLENGALDIVDITKKEDEIDLEEQEISVPKGRDGILDEPSLFTEDIAGDISMQDESSHLQSATGSGEDAAVENTDDARLDDENTSDFLGNLALKGHHSIASSSFSTPPDNSSSSIGLMQSAAAGLIEKHLDSCLHVKAEGSRPCTVLLTASHLILEYEGDGYFEGEILAAEEEAERIRIIEDGGGLRDDGSEGKYQKRAARRQREISSLRPKSIRYNLSEISHIYLRRYRLRDSSIELFFIPSGGATFGGFGIFSATSSLFLDFGPGHEGNEKRDDAAFAIMRRSPPQAMKQWPDRANQFLHEQLQRLTVAWAEGRITNFDYLLHLNLLSGRSYNDICQYPVFPWVLADYTSEQVPNLNDRRSFRDLSKPVGALNPDRLNDFIERFNTFADPSIPPFMYGSHYSTSAGVVLHFLVRLHPFAGLHRQLQGGYFDVADRLFSSVPRTWSMCTGSSNAEVKELTPEWFCAPSFLRNGNKFVLGSSQDGELLGDVSLPPWADKSPEKFVEIMRAALESEICSEMLPDWIDLIFGYKQQGPESVKANNVYFYLTYYGAVDVASIKDESLRHATELQIAHFGQCPMQLFRNRPHLRRLKRNIRELPFYHLLSSHWRTYREKKPDAFNSGLCGEPHYLPFDSAPLSHWVHLDAPPPGPHAPLIAVRFAGNDRCLAVDDKGIFHVFRWTWRAAEIDPNEMSSLDESYFDQGCFVAQRELPRFRKVPRLLNPCQTMSNQTVAVAITKTLFAGRTIMLVLSDADSVGGLSLQLIDPAKGCVRGEVLIPQVHSARITSIATEPIGTAAGHGGVGGELAVVGSEDGNATIWRFMSSHFLPLRPRLHLRGHGGSKIFAVALSPPVQLSASISKSKCCLHSLTNGTLIRSFGPPTNALDLHDPNLSISSVFADSTGLAISVLGFVVCVCQSTIVAGGSERKVVSLSLFTVEGIYLGSKPLEPWRGVPHKIECIPDGTAIMVCSGRGVTFHSVSACNPLDIIDEWQVTEFDDLSSRDSIPAAWDIDLGPSVNRPVVAAAACSNGALRLHALPGISEWSERHRQGGISQTVGNVLAKPAQRFKSAMQGGLGIGKQIAGMGRDIGREVSSDVKERGVGGFLGGMFRKSSS